ncbi:MAG TPA: hypothetical protein VGK36_11745 [Candidatus Angelobacter sp.]|jgi:hypothetical protein
MDSHAHRLTSQLFRRLLCARIWRFVAKAVFAGVITLMGAIRIDQALFRRDSEHLISIIRAFQVGSTTPAQAQQMLQRWPQVKDAKGDCSRQCWIGITLQDSFRRNADFFVRHRRLMSIYISLGGTLAEVRASMQFVNAAFRAHSIGVYVYVPPFRNAEKVWSDYTLIAAASIVPEPTRPGQQLQRTPNPLHPSYRVGPRGGCDGCLIVDVTFAPESNPQDMNRLMQFDLSCLNRWWRPCRTQADIMPAAWKQFLQDQAQR